MNEIGKIKHPCDHCTSRWTQAKERLLKYPKDYYVVISIEFLPVSHISTSQCVGAGGLFCFVLILT